MRADYTVTIQETKVGLVLDPGRSYAGICVSEDIGIVSLPLERDEETVCTLEGSDYAHFFRNEMRTLIKELTESFL